MRHFYMNIVKVYIAQSSAHPYLAPNNTFHKEILEEAEWYKITSKSRIIMIGSYELLFSQKNEIF